MNVARKKALHFAVAAVAIVGVVAAGVFVFRPGGDEAQQPSFAPGIKQEPRDEELRGINAQLPPGSPVQQVNDRKTQQRAIVARDFETLLSALEQGDLEAGRELYKAIQPCADFPDANERARLRSAALDDAEVALRVAGMEARSAKCGVFSDSQRARYDEILITAAKAGDVQALKQLYTRVPRLSGDPVDASQARQRKELVRSLVNDAIDSGSSEILLEYAIDNLRGITGDVDAVEAYASLLALQSVGGLNDLQRAHVEQLLEETKSDVTAAELERVESRAQALLDRCCT